MQKLIVYIGLHHLNKKAREQVRLGVVNFYDLVYANVHPHTVSRRYEYWRDKGYALVLVDGERSLLMMYNKASEINRKTYLYLRGQFRVISPGPIDKWGSRIEKGWLIGICG